MELEDEYDDDYEVDRKNASRIMSLEMEGATTAEDELRLEMYDDSEQEGMVALVNGRNNRRRRYNYGDGYDEDDDDIDDHQSHSFCYWFLHPQHLTYRLKQQRPYMPLYCVAAIVFAVLLLSILYVPKQHEFLLPTNITTGGVSSCGNFSNDDITKFLQDINRLPPKERCSKNHQPNCQCMNPLIPSIPATFNPNNKQREWAEPWNKTFHRNLNLVEQNINRHLDVVLLGDSIIEHWLGTTFATPSPRFAENKQVYEKLFQQGSSSSTSSSSTTKSNSVQGLALGIAGDRCSQLLYRLQNGEMGSNITGQQQEQELLEPSVWWILIGTNDFGTGDMCNDDSIVAGNIRIFQQIRQQRPNATIVIQSLLPVLNNKMNNGDNGDGQSSSGDQQLEPRLWDWYSNINERLECFTTSSPYQHNLHFYNATPLFFNSDQRTVNKSLLPDGVHPTGKGKVERKCCSPLRNVNGWM